MIAAQGPNVHVLLLNDDQHDTNTLKLDMTKQEIVQTFNVYQDQKTQ